MAGRRLLAEEGSWMDARVVGMSRRPDAVRGLDGWMCVGCGTAVCLFGARSRLESRGGGKTKAVRPAGGGVLTVLCAAGVDEG